MSEQIQIPQYFEDLRFFEEKNFFKNQISFASPSFL